MNAIEHLATGLIPPGPVIKITDPVLFNVCMAAKAKDDVRYYLTYLHINPTDNRVTGSNGEMLASGQAIDCRALQNEKQILIRPQRRLPNGTVSAEINLKTQLITGRAKSPFTIPFDTIGAKYPNFNQLVNNVNDIESSQLAFQPNALRKLSKAALSRFATLSAHQGRRDTGELAPIFYRVHFNSSQIHSDYIAVIMPARL